MKELRKSGAIGHSHNVDMLTGSPLKKILTFCLPLFAVNILSILTSTLTTRIYSRFVGEEGFYIPSLVGNAVSYIGCIVGGVISAAMIYVARAKGEGDPGKRKKYLCNAVYAVLLVDVAVCLAFVAAYRPIFRLLHVPREVYGKAFLYYGWYLASYIFTAFGSLVISVAAVQSNTVHIFVLNVLNTCFHSVVSFVLLGIFKAGLAGIATYMSVNSLIVCGAGLFFFSKNGALRLKLSELKPDFRCIFRLIGYGLLLSAQSIFCNFGYLMSSMQTNALLSAKYIAVCGVVSLPVSAPMSAISSAISVFCAQNHGAGNGERIRKGIGQAFIAVELYALFCMLVNIFVAEPYWNFMFDDAELIRLGIDRWRVSSSGFLFLGSLYVFRFALDSMGYGKYTVFCGLCEFVMQIFCAFWLIPETGNLGASAAQGLSWALSAVYIMAVYAAIVRKKLITLPKKEKEAVR